jgi:hypothetical protein
MTFGNFKVKQEAGGDRITDRQSAATFILSLDSRRAALAARGGCGSRVLPKLPMMKLRLATRSKRLWRRKAGLNNAGGWQDQLRASTGIDGYPS